LVNCCELLYIDFSPLATCGKSRMLSAFSGISTNHTILRHGALFFFLAYGENGDDWLHKAMGTKAKRRTNLLKPAL